MSQAGKPATGVGKTACRRQVHHIADESYHEDEGIAVWVAE
jgi:hypothetical protein